MKLKHLTAHGLAFFTILIWGSTFAITRMLLDAGMGADEIMIFRFVIAYVLLWIIHPRFMRPTSFSQELMFFLAGACGVTLYFLAENQALSYTTVSNTSLLVTTAPLFTGLLAAVFMKMRLNAAFFIGFAFAMAGVVLILFHGGIPKIYPKGDLLALAAALCWAVYSLAVKRTDNGKTHLLAATRRIFFYGILLFILMSLIIKTEFHFSVLFEPRNLLEMLFLSVIASALCYVSWNHATHLLGPVTSNLYIYLIPVTALITARVFFNESMPPLGWAGAMLVLAGLIISALPQSTNR